MEPFRTTQDAFSLLPTTVRKNNKDMKGIYLGVYDGHGEYGGDCSGLCKDFVVLSDLFHMKMEKAVLAHSSTTEETTDLKLEEELEKCNTEMHERKYALLTRRRTVEPPPFVCRSKTQRSRV